MVGVVTTWMGDYLWASKPSWYEANRLGQLSLLLFVGWQMSISFRLGSSKWRC